MSALLSAVGNRGPAPTKFISEVVEWAETANPSVFAPNDNPRDIYATVRNALGPWESALHRRAVLCEVMRVHAGFESSWNWTEGVDTTNHSSVAHAEGQETGIFQVSFDSTFLGGGAMHDYAVTHGITTPATFISRMKSDHVLALDYYAWLMRVSVAWAGPVKRHEIDRWLSRDAVREFMALLS